ncbi:MupA/Atu3671 family FMN-dependent luciferase-like monooxygenase [Streptomyces xiamenensis]|uniref:MupA/Atu3671 family FMN-dependent luciferase-like monooxygenase n=2 Tax=Streptomyces xiamenensis TaxID=408015 RepID=UPI0035D5FD3C
MTRPGTELSSLAASTDADLAAMAGLSERIARHIERRAPAPEQPADAGGAAGGGPAPVHGPRVSVSRSSGMVRRPAGASGAAVNTQEAHLDDLVERYTRRTRRSKEATARHRPVLADSRAVVGFRSSTKEMLYPIAGRRAKGSTLEDIDGNRYIDITMGFGVLLFGHEPEFVTEAVAEHLSRGVLLGPRDLATGEAAELLTGLTGLDRVAFACSGTEANAGAIRLARAATGRGTIVTFHGAYHGHADSVLGRSSGSGADRVTVPVSPGIPPSAVQDLLVLDYGAPASLETIEHLADRIAAVIIEPVQSRHPSLRPVEFVRALRELTRRHGIVLMFDEMLTGFRPAPRGAQELYGVAPDLATYGKVLGGGFPVGAIAGRSDLMSGVDGGLWAYGDDSHPQSDTTFFGGTYLQHPVSMVAARAVLSHLTEHSPVLQQRLNARTDAFAATLNDFFEDEEFPLRVSHFGSQFRFEHRADMELLYHHLMLRGIHVWEWRNFFLSTAHSDGDIERIIDAVKESLRELRAAGFFPRTAAPGSAPVSAPGRATVPAPVTAPVAAADPVAAPEPAAQDAPPPAVPALAWNTRATQATRPAATPPVSEPARRRTDFSLYFFGDYPQVDNGYELIAETARFADQHGFHALWMPERHFHSFGGLFPNPAVLAAALARETSRIRLNAGSVVLPLHDPVRVAEEWSMADNLSGGRIGIGCASGWHANDFVFFPERFGRHKELMYEQLADIRRLWRGEALTRAGGDGQAAIRLFPRPVQQDPPMFTAVVGNPASYELAARHDLGIVTNLMSQSVEELAANIARYRRARAEHGLDPDAGRVAVLLHTYLAADHDQARADAYEPLARYMRSSLSLFGGVANSLGYKVDLTGLDEDDLDALFRRAYDRYCDQRALIGTAESVSPVVEAVSAAGADEIVSLVDFGVPPRALRSGLVHLDALRRGHSGTGSRRPQEPQEPQDPGTPLSPGQQRVWMLHQLFPDSTAYNEVKAIRFDGALDADTLRTALHGLVARHPALRTVFRETDGEPRQFVLPTGRLDHELIDHETASEEEREAAVREVLAAESARHFDLENGPLLVSRLIRTGPQRHVLVLSLHHIVSDAASATIMARDLSELYRAARTGTAPQLPVLERTPLDAAREQRAARDGDTARQDLAYWRENLRGELPVSSLPLDRPRSAAMTSRGRAEFRTLDPELSDALRRLSREHRTTLFMTLLTGYAAALHRMTGVRDVVIGTPTSNRPPEYRDVIGFFLNTVALRVDLSGDPAFETLLRKVRSVALDAYDHAALPFDSVVQALAPPRTTAHTPVFQVIAEYESGEPFRFDLPGLRAEPLEAGPDKSLTDLSVYFTDRPTGILCQLEYNTDLFDADTVDLFYAALHRILRGAVRDPARPLSALDEPPAEAAHDTPVPQAWQHGEEHPVEAVTVHERVARQAALAPHRTAVICGDRELTYGELDRRADRLAATIRRQDPGTDPAAPVAVWLPRGPDLVVALLAVLKAGRPYLPLDPSLGRPRAGTVIAHAGAPILLAARGDAPDLPPLPADTRVVGLADPPGDAAPPPAAAVSGPQDPCYVIYTSGSTGGPKGVVVPHRAVVNLCQWHHRRFSFTPADRSALLCSQSFDASVLEIWPTLTAGASLAVADDTDRQDARALARWYADRHVTFSILPTALAETVLELPAHEQPPLRHLAVGGDILRTRPRAGSRYEVVNLYGPTEVTVLCTAYGVTPDGPGEDSAPIPIGRPIDNVRLAVLDEHGAPAPVGTPGELSVGGPGIADGYLHEPALTADRFRHERHPGGGSGRMYRTGDLVRWTAEGVLEFLGRGDDQVKIRGFRVDPEEVSRVLAGLPEVREAIVLPRPGPRDEPRLVAFVAPAHPRTDAGEGARAFADRLTRQLADRLPEYLVPRAWSVLDRLPLSGTGKVDRAALPAPGYTTRLPAPARAPEPAAPAPAPAAASGEPGEWEARLRPLWAAEFGLDPDAVDPDVSFFDLGGHSITAIRLANRIRAEFATDFSMTRFYQEPTPRAVARHLAGLHSGPARELAHRAPPTLQQQGFITGHHEHPLPQVYNVAMRITLTGELDPEDLRTALGRLVARHESLRLRFVEENGAWSQEVLPPRPVDLPVEDLSAHPADARDTEVDRVSAELAQTPFDLTAGVRPRFRLLRTGPSTWVLLFVLHHASCDGWAVSVLLHDWAALYAAAVSGIPDQLPEPLQSTDYARWQQRHALPEREAARRAAYWVPQLTGAPFRTALPLDRPRPPKPSGKGRAVLFTVPAEVRRDVERLAAARGTTAFAVTGAALGLLLSGLSGQPDVLLSVPYANRDRGEFESLVACTAATYVLRVRAGDARDFGALVDGVTRAATEGVDHVLPLRKVVAALREKHGPEGIPDRVTIGFQYQSSLRTDIKLPGLDTAVEDLIVPAARAESAFGLVPAGDILTGYIAYATDLWDHSTVQGWADAYVRLLTEKTREELHK